MGIKNERPAELPFPDERKAGRQIANFAATVRELGSAPMQAKILDVGPGGGRLADCRLDCGAEIWLQLPGREPLRATVVWSRGSRAGCEFYVPVKSLLDERRRQAAPVRRVLFGPRAVPRRSGRLWP